MKRTFESHNTSNSSMAEDSETVKLRKKGNEHYVSASEGLCSSVRENRMQKALKCYHQSMQAADSKVDYASAAKNYAQASRRLGSIFSETCQKSMMSHHYKLAVKYYVKAQEAGKLCMEVPWLIKLAEVLQNCLQQAVDDAIDVVCDAKEKMIFVEGYLAQLPEDHKLKPDAFLLMGEMIFRAAVVATSEKRYKDALGLLKDCNFPLEEARRLGHERVDIMEEVKILQVDVYYQTCAAESIQACDQGDIELTRTLQQEESLHVDRIWCVIDFYKQAILLTRENEVELEAIALSKIGHVYHKVLVLPQRAKESYLKSVQLALSLHPRVFTNDDWFKEATEVVRQFQEQATKEQDEKDQKERSKYHKELKDELAKLKEYENEDATAVLKFVYVTWPPKNPNHKMPAADQLLDCSQRKKALMKSILHYHGDKQDVEAHGLKWKYLCEEITKLLTRKYECYKG